MTNQRQGNGHPPPIEVPYINVTAKIPRPRGRPPGGGAGLDYAVATKLRADELAALDTLTERMGLANRAETIRYLIRLVIGGTGV
jgi:hypothetical protein